MSEGAPEPRLVLASFLDVWEGCAPVDDELEGAVAELLEEARATLPRVVVREREFGHHLGLRADPSEPPAQAIRRLHGVDLLLAWACLDGQTDALGELEARYLRSIPSYLGHMRLPSASVDEVRQRFSEKLLVARDGTPPRLASYRGQGSLESWIRVGAVRAALSLVRRIKHHTPEELAPEAALAESGHPELDFLKQRYRADFADAFRTSIAALEQRQRSLLRLHFVDRVTISSMAKLYGVHRVTMAKWLASAKQALLEATRERLRDRLQLSPSECDSLIHLVGSRLEASLSTVFESAPS